ncbi:MAG TPA: hypothetical protein PKW55_03265 [Spirochaetota bacterium]|nr:hypothetical protein [Spirochaetota bacterium]HOM39245.1 hypothetical protein [Spirochaetota bacterium]HPQ48652.1 hypothetical protein [Spirochaetota bacterium]
MQKHVVIIYQKNREETAVKLQSILTKYGCLIKTRLGIHDGVVNACTPTGLIILETVGEIKEIKNMVSEIEQIKDTDVKLIELNLD